MNKVIKATVGEYASYTFYCDHFGQTEGFCAICGKDVKLGPYNLDHLSEDDAS